MLILLRVCDNAHPNKILAIFRREKQMQFKHTLFVACIGASVAMPAVAADLDLSLDDIVVTGTRSETAVLDLAGNTSKVDAAEIDLLNADHIEETLLRIPGMNMQRLNGVEMTVALRSPVLTGPGGGGAFLFMEDGIPLRSSAFGNNQGLSEAHFEQAGGIEVVRGPGSALYGSNAVHGLINVLTRSPAAELERSLNLTLGSDDLYKLRGTVSNTIGAHGYRATFSGVADSGWRDESGLDQQKLTLRHDYFSPSGDSFKTTFSAFNVNQETAGFITSETDDELYKRGSSVTETNENPDGYRDWWSMRLATRWDHEMANGNTLSITPYLRSTEMEFRQHYLPSKAIEENGHDSVGVQTAYYMDLAGGHNVILGMDFDYTEGHLKQTQQRESYFKFGKARQQGVHYDYDVDVLVLAPFVHAEWQLADKLRATTGLRLEHTAYQYDNNIADGTGEADGSACFKEGKECLYQRPGDRDDTFNDWSPKLGLIYNLSDEQSVFANVSRGLRAPQTTDIYRIQKNQTIGALDSERADNLEIGVRGRFDSGLDYDLSAFYMQKKNFSFRDSFGNSVTDATTKHRGIEGSFSMPLGGNFDIGASATYAIHEYDSSHAAKPNLASQTITSGDDIDTAPRTIANIRLGWNFKAASRAELEWSHIGSYYMDPANTSKYDGHDLLNLRISSKVSSGLTVHGQIKNLLDEEYADRADFAFGDYRFFPGRERYYEIGATLDF